MEESEIVVVAAGAGPDVSALIADDALVIAADGGLERARALGLRPSLVVGDLDSVEPDALAGAEADGAEVVAHPQAKDATDVELALHEAAAREPARVLLVASADGRLDHVLSLLQVLGCPALDRVEVDALVGDALVHVVRGERRLRGARGETLTLLALHGAAEGVTTEGLAYPLRGETLLPFSSRGVSNVFAEEEATVTVEHGLLLAVRPGPEAVRS